MTPHLLDEIRSQSHGVRVGLFVLSVFVTATFVGFLWFTGIERRMFFAIHDEPEERAAFLARQDARIPAPVAAIGALLESMPARIGDFVGIDRSAGFDRPSGEDTVYPLPIVN
jgi:hypothetical protein